MEEDNNLPFAERRPMLASVPCDHPKLLTGDPPAPRDPDDGWKNASNRAGIVESQFIFDNLANLGARNSLDIKKR